MRLLLVITLMIFAGVTRADDAKPVTKEDRDRKAKAAFAFAAAGNPELCVCAKGKALTWAKASEKATLEDMPIVLFCGGIEPRCTGDAVAAVLSNVPMGFDPEKPIVVYVQSKDGLGGKGWKIVNQLPANASKQEIKDAVKKAKAND